jgi:fatty acid desaturase
VAGFDERRGRGHDEPSRAEPVAGVTSSSAVAILEPEVPVERDETDEFRDLAIRIRDAGLLDRRPGYYGVKISLTVTACVAGWAALLLVGDSWWTLGVAAFLGVTFTQLGFVGHDAGHLQVFRSRRANHALGLAVANALMGVSFGWWVPKHSAHHAHPNEIGRDPDLGEGIVVCPDAATDNGRRSVTRWLARRQAWLFFPLMLLRSIGLHVSGIRRLARRRDRAAAMEAALIALHLVLYATAVLLVLSPLRALAFVVVQQAVFSVYLGCSFAPNHKGMPLVEDAEHMSFVRRQVLTARNVAGGRLTTFVLGGLNYQIEHHLFPTMPRPNLARAQAMVQAFCTEANLTYTKRSVVGSFGQIVRHLRDLATGTLLVPVSSVSV